MDSTGPEFVDPVPEDSGALDRLPVRALDQLALGAASGEAAGLAKRGAPQLIFITAIYNPVPRAAGSLLKIAVIRI